MAGVGRDLWRYLAAHSCICRPTWRGSPGPFPTFGYLQAGRCHKPSRQPVLVVSYSQSEKMFPDVQKEYPVFHFVPAASGPGTGHYWKEPGSIFTPSLQIFMYAGKIPAELSLLQTDQSQLSQPYSTEEVLQSLDMFVTLCWLDSLQYVPTFVLLKSPEQATALQMWPHQCWVKGWCGFPGLPWPAGNALPKAELHRPTHLLARAQQSKVSMQLGGTQETLVHEAQRGGNTIQDSWVTMWEGRWPVAGRRWWWSTVTGDTGESGDHGRHCNALVGQCPPKPLKTDLIKVDTWTTRKLTGKVN